MRKLAFAGALWLLLALACNLPVNRASPTGLPAVDLRKTLAARSVDATAGPALALERTAVPGDAQHTAAPAQFGSLSTATPGAPQPADSPVGDFFTYITVPGDTLPALSLRFGVGPEQIIASQPLSESGLLPAGQPLQIPNTLGSLLYPSAALPDDAVVYGPSAVDFDISAYIQAAGGFLASYSENFNGEILTGAQSVQRVATESSINPRLLLALLESRSQWVFGQPANQTVRDYPLGFHVANQKGLYRELVMTATHLNIAYYGWRSGTESELQFRDGRRQRIDPRLNAGSVAVQSLLAKLNDQPDWLAALYAPGGLLDAHQVMFGDPWARSAHFGALLPRDSQQPALELPFQPGERWSLTGGPHPVWKTGSPRGALDFAPVTGEPACQVSRAWVTAPASGLVVRSQRNVLALDLDGDGYEQTGWVLIFLHLADFERLPAGVRVELDDRLGHPSCEGGQSTGTHVHIARKFNGEWIAVEGPLPFVLGGWQAYADARNYYGGMRKGDQEVVASPVGPRTSIIVR